MSNNTITTITIGTNPGTTPATTITCDQCRADIDCGVDHERCPHNWGPSDLGQDVQDWAVDTVQDCLADYFDGATIIPCLGIWKGDRERSVRVEITHSASVGERNALASLIKRIHRAFIAGGLPQDCILVQHQTITTEFWDVAHSTQFPL